MKPLLIAHRGASENAPENTLAAFRLAWEEGADGIEGDFQLTADGEVVCIHDADTWRVARRRRVVSRNTFEKLSKLDVGKWKSRRFEGERIPRLSEVLAVLPADKWFFIEIKAGVAAVEPIRRILEAGQANPERVVMICFDAVVVAACRHAMPAFQAHWISALKGVHKPVKAEAYKQQLEASTATGLQFDCRAPVDAGWLASLGKPTASWTVNDPVVGRRLAAMGVDFLTTNRPGALRTEMGG